MFTRLIKKIVKKEKGRGSVNLIFVRDAKMRRLNRRFRGKDKPTDVLAFPMREDGVLGDIAISTQTARRNAKRFGVRYNEELKRLVVHATLHLLGYEHGRKMSHAEKIYAQL